MNLATKTVLGHIASGWKRLLSSGPEDLSLVVPIFQRAQQLSEKAHPSEDGEALRNSELSLSADEFGSRLEVVPNGSTPLRWFAVYTTCRHEKRIAQHLSHRDIEFYLPLYRSERKWRDGSKVELDLPLFPGYIFVHIRRSERTSVLSVPGAVAVVGGTGGEPGALPDDAIDALRAGLMARKVEPHALVRVGQQVRIRSGAFAGMSGVVVRKKSGLRVVLTLEQIMQSIAVEVGEEDLDPIGETGNQYIGGLDLRICGA